jgi:hypothetical protein
LDGNNELSVKYFGKAHDKEELIWSSTFEAAV